MPNVPGGVVLAPLKRMESNSSPRPVWGNESMLHRMFAICCGLIALTLTAEAQVFYLIIDEFDSINAVQAAQDQEITKPTQKLWKDLSAGLESKNLDEMERMFGKPTKMPENTYAMPVVQPRGYGMPGARSTKGKDHTAFYAVADFAGLEVRYGADGKSARWVVVYFKVDKTFPKLTSDNLKERLAWDEERLLKLTKLVEERQKSKK